MMKTAITYAIWMAGFVLAPHSLALLGNITGFMQWQVLLFLVAAVALYGLNSVSLSAMVNPGGHPVNEQAFLSKTLGVFTPAIMLLAGRILTTIALATVLLVTAGFAFNETLVYWFPNFVFAFLLLGLVMTIQLLSHRAATYFQMLAGGVVLAGILWLTGYGLINTPAMPVQSVEAIHVPKNMWMGAILLFIGFDTVLNYHRLDKRALLPSLMTAIVLIGIVMGLWSVVSLLYVPANKLTQSFLPHMLTAKAVASQTGRVIMAVVIIAGSGAAVNALFMTVARTVSHIVTLSRPRGRLGRIAQRRSTWTIACTVAIGGMMAGGMAGSDTIDIYVRAGLYSWLLCYGVIHLGTWLQPYARKAPLLVSNRLAAVGFVITLLGFLLAVYVDPNRTLLIPFMVLSWLALSAVIWLTLYRKTHK